MATFNNSAAYSIVYSQKGVLYQQDGNYFTTQFEDLGVTMPAAYQSMSSERSDVVDIVGGTIDGVTIGPNSTIEASISGSTLTNPTISGGSINGTDIGDSDPAPGAFTTLNSDSANILGPLSAEGVNATTNSEVADPANTGVALSASSNWASITYYDATRGADAKTADVVWESGALSLRFKNDAGSDATTWLQAVGAYNAVTGITSNSGSGAWRHTGLFTVGASTVTAPPTSTGVHAFAT